MAGTQVSRELVEWAHVVLVMEPAHKSTLMDQSVEMRAEPARMPEDWLIAHRREGDGCPLCGGEIRTLEMGSRTGYYCASHQSSASHQSGD